MTGEFDTAGKGACVVLAGTYRGLETDIYHYTEDQVIAVFHGFDQFFDCVDPATILPPLWRNNRSEISDHRPHNDPFAKHGTQN